MGKKLVIVESPAKAKTINKILGSDFIVKSSMGHIRDLPVKNLGVDVENDFKPKYVTVRGRKRVVDELKKVAKEADAIYLAPDPDREGEAIAWHLKELLAKGKTDDRFHRVQYNEITPRAVKAAFDEPGEIDMDRVDAQQARRVVDRLVGYTVSPLLWRQVGRGLSAGRVQSVALRLLCERQKEINDFVAEAFWIIGATARKLMAPTDPFNVKLLRINGEKAEIKSEEQSQGILDDLEGRKLQVAAVNTRTVTKRAPPPFITSTLQQAGSSAHGFSPRRTMALAQHLYEGIDLGGGPEGLITYMRTDSFSISRDAMDACRGYITNTLGKEYCPEKPNLYRSRKSAQEAHEAIRPTDVNRTPESMAGKLDPADLKLYRLIWRRFVASQMAPAKIDQRTVEIDAPVADASGDKAGHTYLFQASSSEVSFPGYMKVSGSQKQEKSEEGGDGSQELPPLKEGEPLSCLEWLSERKETKPPARFSEASLIRALESNGVGRPSTYAQTVATLHQRAYVLREKRTLSPTDLGMQVNDLLVAKLGSLFDVAFTAKMEESLDQVEKGSAEWTSMVGSFYEQFSEWMEKAKTPAADTEAVSALLEAFEGVTDWEPPTTRGKRTYSDEKFVTSLAKQRESAKKAISQRQLEALARIAARYREKGPAVEGAIKASGMTEYLAAEAQQPPRESTVKKLDVLRGADLGESARSFVDSLDARVTGGRRLTNAQLDALNNVVTSHAAQIPDLEARRDELELGNAETVTDNESGPLLEAMSAVKEWKPPVTRGKRTFNDQEFFDSLGRHYERRRFLSVRQRGALKRMLTRYKDQIPTYDQLAEEYELGKPKSKQDD